MEYLLGSPCRGDSNKYTKRMIYKKNCSEESVIYGLDWSRLSFLDNSSKLFGNKRCRYNEGPLYEPGRIAQSVAHLTQESDVQDSIPTTNHINR